MKVIRIIPCFVFLVALVAACSHAPRLDRDADATADFRAGGLDFLRQGLQDAGKLGGVDAAF